MRTLDPVRDQPNGLTALLRKYAERAKRLGKNQAHIAREAWLDES